MSKIIIKLKQGDVCFLDMSNELSTLIIEVHNSTNQSVSQHTSELNYAI